MVFLLETCRHGVRIGVTQCHDVTRLARIRGICRAIGDEPRSGKLCYHLAAFSNPIHRLGDHFPNHGRGQIPFVENSADGVFMPLLCHDQHSLLRFAQQDFVRSHAAFARRHLRNVDRDADISALGHLRRR